MVMTLTEWSERTVRRRLADGALKCADDSGPYNKTLICFSSIQQDVCIPLSIDDFELIELADSGHAASQNDLALLFFAHGKPKSAMVWLEVAAKQSFPDAMQWLGECYLRGECVGRDEHLAIMWIAKAASLGHSIAMAQMKSMQPRVDGGRSAFWDKRVVNNELTQ